MPHGTKSYQIQKELYAKYTAQMEEVNAREFKKRIRLLLNEYQVWVNKNYAPKWKYDLTNEFKIKYKLENDTLKKENSSLKYGQQILKAASHKAVNSTLGDA